MYNQLLIILIYLLVSLVLGFEAKIKKLSSVIFIWFLIKKLKSIDS